MNYNDSVLCPQFNGECRALCEIEGSINTASPRIFFFYSQDNLTQQRGHQHPKHLKWMTRSCGLFSPPSSHRALDFFFTLLVIVAEDKGENLVQFNWLCWEKFIFSFHLMWEKWFYRFYCIANVSVCSLNQIRGIQKYKHNSINCLDICILHLALTRYSEHSII